MNTVSIVLDHISSYICYYLFSLFTHLQTTSMTGDLSTILKNNYLNTVRFVRMFRDSVDIFEDYLYVVF